MTSVSNLRQVSRNLGVPLLGRGELSNLAAPFSTGCGVYFLFKGNRIVYVGQSRNVMQRVGVHADEKDFDRMAWVETPREHLNLVESLYIHTLRPRLNAPLGGYKKLGRWQNKAAPLSAEALASMEVLP